MIAEQIAWKKKGLRLFCRGFVQYYVQDVQRVRVREREREKGGKKERDVTLWIQLFDCTPMAQ